MIEQKRLNTTILLILLVQSILGQAKYPYIEEFNLNNGLPNAYINCILKDSRGYIWIGTMYGLAKYDGNKFTIYKHDKGTNSISGDFISAIYEDNKGNILVGANGLSIFNRNFHKWQNYLHDPSNPYSISKNSISSIAQENDSIYWLITYSGLDRFNIKTGKFIKKEFPSNGWLINTKILEINGDSSIIIKNRNDFFLLYNIKNNNYSFLPFNFFHCHTDVILNNCLWSFKVDPLNDESWIYKINLRNHTSTKLIRINDKNSVLFHNNNYVGCCGGNRVSIFDSNGYLVSSNIINYQYKNILYTCGLIENNGTIWIGTEKGLFKLLPQTPFSFIDNNNGLPNEYIRSLTIDHKNNLWIGVRGSSIFKISNIDNYITNFNNSIETIIIEPTHATNQIAELKNGDFIFSTIPRIDYYNTFQSKVTSKFIHNSVIQNFSVLEFTNGILIGNLEKPYLYKLILENGQLKQDTQFRNSFSLNGVYNLYRDSDNNVWLGSEGLYKLHNLEKFDSISFEECIPPIDSVDKFNNSCWDILEIDNKRLIVCTTSNGFYIYNKQTKEYQHFNKKNGIPTDYICAVQKDHHNNLWMTTKEGISHLNTKDYSITNYEARTGTFIYDFNYKCCVKTMNNWLLFGSKQGIVYFHPDSIKPDNTNYQLIINEVKVFNDIAFTELSDKDTITLKHEQNFFSFDFSLQDYRNPKNIHYNYFLKGYDKIERITDGKNPIASYTDVPTGKYSFILKGFNTENPEIKQQIEIAVIVQPTFYQTWYFILFVILLSISILGTIFFLFIKRYLLKKRLYKMELDLLRTQINPHFIFNTLTSIQHTILKSSKNTAIEYTTKFSKLIRLCLDYSRQEYISLENAIQFYKTYVSVESVNLREEINFQISLDESINAQLIKISPMIIQPFIENAIIHGLSHKNDNMQLSLNISKAEDYLLCVLIDNGIGRAKATEIAKNNESGHKSMGIEITRKRILMQLQKNVPKKDYFEIIDNFDENGIACGTTVKLRISYK